MRWVLIAVLALTVRIGAGIVTGGLTHPERFEYDSAARAIVAGQGFVYYHIGVPYYSYMVPLSSWVGAAGYWATGSILPLMLLQCLAGTALAVMAAAIARRLFGHWLAEFAAGVFVALHPGLIVYSATKAHALAFDAFFFALALLAAFRLRDQLTWGRAAAFGVAVGIGALTRGTIVIMLPLVGLWLLWISSGPVRMPAVSRLVVAGLVATAVIAPWTIRNSLIHHRFVFLLTTDAEDFWRGNNPYATGHSYVDKDHIVLTSIPPEELADLQGQPDELSQAKWFSDRARAFVREHPDQFARLTLMKFYQFWWFAPQSGTLYPRLWLRLYQAYYVTILILAAIGVSRLFRAAASARHDALLIGAFLLMLSGLQSLYYVEGRHRWAVEPMLIAFSGGGVAFLARSLRVKRDDQFGTPAVVRSR